MLTWLNGQSPRKDIRTPQGLISDRVEPVPTLREIGIVKVAENTFKKVVEGFYGS
jgi:hypothetical protein